MGFQRQSPDQRLEFNIFPNNYPPQIYAPSPSCSNFGDQTMNCGAFLFIPSCISGRIPPPPRGSCPPGPWLMSASFSGIARNCVLLRSRAAPGAGPPLQLPGPHAAGARAPRLPPGQQHPEPRPGTPVRAVNHTQSLSRTPTSRIWKQHRVLMDVPPT